MHFVPLSQAFYGSIPAPLLFLILRIIGTACFAYIAARRVLPLLRAQRDPRFDRPVARLLQLLKFWLGQWRHPRYKFAGILHILIFAGFLILVARVAAVMGMAFSDNFSLPFLSGPVYDVLKDYAATVVFIAVAIAIVRRAFFMPARYAVPQRFGKDHTPDAIFLLGLIGFLMLADGLFEGSKAAAEVQAGLQPGFLAPLSLSWCLEAILAPASSGTLWAIYLGAYLAHELTFFFLLCYRPFGVQFHVETSLFSIYFAKLNRSALKPVRWGVPDGKLDEVKSFGVKTFTDFTWKHVLDFYSCADCGRCSDNCPANAAGRPLSPRFINIKARDYAFRHYPMLGSAHNGTPLVGTLYSEDEIWSCTTCGACEAECPLLVEWIDKIVDLRRGMVDDGNVPQSLQKPLKALESRGNPYGKPEKKRADWAKTAGTPILNGQSAETLYFVDSVTSFDERIQSIGRSTANILARCRIDYGILGPAERDSGHDVRRFGEELLFQSLRDHNSEAIRASGVERIVTADPHAYNALRHDYSGLPPVEHISETIAREVRSGTIQFKPVANADDVYTYHDPCYLGRHNQVFDQPREVLDAIPGLRRVEMARCRDRSFCCGGGGLALFYEASEDERIGVKRVRMAAEAGANVIITACPFCMVNIEDAIKVAGLEGKMTAIDLAELADRQMAAKAPDAASQLQVMGAQGE
jgi:Fe-S oxidoreductase